MLGNGTRGLERLRDFSSQLCAVLRAFPTSRPALVAQAAMILSSADFG